MLHIKLWHSILNPYKQLFHNFHSQESRYSLVRFYAYLDSLLRVSRGWNPGTGQTTFSCGGWTREEFTSKLIWVIERIHLLVVVRRLLMAISQGQACMCVPPTHTHTQYNHGSNSPLPLPYSILEARQRSHPHSRAGQKYGATLVSACHM